MLRAVCAALETQTEENREMSETMQAQEQEQSQAAQQEIPATAETSTETKTETFTLANVKREYFGPDEAEKAVEHVSKVMEVCPENSLLANFDFETEEVPDGWGIAVVPISKRIKDDKSGDTSTVNLGAVVARVPSPELILDDEKGKEFVRRVLMDNVFAQIASASRPDKDTGQIDREAFVPKELTDFITIRTKGEGLKTFNMLAPDVLKMLKKKSPALKFLNAALLRQALQNASWANSTLPNIPQEHWEALLKAMIALARKKEADPSILQQWLARRDQAEMEAVVVEDFDAAIASLE